MEGTITKRLPRPYAMLQAMLRQGLLHHHALKMHTRPTHKGQHLHGLMMFYPRGGRLIAAQKLKTCTIALSINPHRQASLLSLPAVRCGLVDKIVNV
jgi:hypothetical protein